MTSDKEYLTLCCIAWPKLAPFNRNFDFKIKRDDKKFPMNR